MGRNVEQFDKVRVTLVGTIIEIRPEIRRRSLDETVVEWEAFGAVDDAKHYDGLPPSFFRKDYLLFAALAGVQNRWGVVPIDLPRGAPEDTSEAVSTWLEEFADDIHSVTWLGLNEITAWEGWSQEYMDSCLVARAIFDDEGHRTTGIDRLPFDEFDKVKQFADKHGHLPNWPSIVRFLSHAEEHKCDRISYTSRLRDDVDPEWWQYLLALHSFATQADPSFYTSDVRLIIAFEG